MSLCTDRTQVHSGTYGMPTIIMPAPSSGTRCHTRHQSSCKVNVDHESHHQTTFVEGLMERPCFPMMHNHGAMKQLFHPHRFVGIIERDHAAEEVAQAQNQTQKRTICCLGHLGLGVTIECPAPVGEALIEGDNRKTGTLRVLPCHFRCHSQTRLWLTLGRNPTTVVFIASKRIPEHPLPYRYRVLASYDMHFLCGLVVHLIVYFVLRNGWEGGPN